jgi:TPR repeat protein
VPQDYGIARSWYEKAVQKGESVAMHDIGRLYHDGKGVPQDLGISRSWYEKASEKGDIMAPFDLAAMLARGEGGPRDPRAAARYLLAAARAGNTTARQDLDGDMRSWDDQVRMAVQELLSASGDYRGRVGGWWDRMCSDAARAYYMRRS